MTSTTKTGAIELRERDFQSRVVDSRGVAMVDFWAPWCGPCKVMGPIVDRLAGEYADRAGVYKVNVDEAPALASAHSINSIPTVLLFVDGEVRERIVGLVSEDRLRDLIDDALGGVR